MRLGVEDVGTSGHRAAIDQVRPVVCCYSVSASTKLSAMTNAL